MVPKPGRDAELVAKGRGKIPKRQPKRNLWNHFGGNIHWTSDVFLVNLGVIYGFIKPLYKSPKLKERLCKFKGWTVNFGWCDTKRSMALGFYLGPWCFQKWLTQRKDLEILQGFKISGYGKDRYFSEGTQNVLSRLMLGILACFAFSMQNGTFQQYFWSAFQSCRCIIKEFPSLNLKSYCMEGTDTYLG